MLEYLKNGHAMGPIVYETEQQINEIHREIEQIAEIKQYRILQSYRKHQVSDSHFIPSTGYGYDDRGRDTLEEIYAEVFGGESGLVRPQIISGTHAISISLFGVLRPGDELLYR
jgi:cystathionine beta-lyase family protein involved in aluminum resistance